MNKIGLHSGYWGGDGVERDGFDLVKLAKQVGVDVVELGPQLILDMGKEMRRDLKKAIADAGLVINFNGGLGPRNDIAVEDEGIRREGIEYSKRALFAMAEMGGRNWSGINYSAWLRRPEGALTPEYKKRAFDLSVTSMREIIRTAEDVGITYGYEVVNRFEQFILNTAKEGVAYCEAVGSPNAKLLLDTFHMSIEEDDLRQALTYALKAGRLSHVHVGEANRRVPGTGPSPMDWPGIFKALKDGGYEGFITMEPFVRMGNPSICVWRDLVKDTSQEALIRDAAKGAAFLRGML